MGWTQRHILHLLVCDNHWDFDVHVAFQRLHHSIKASGVSNHKGSECRFSWHGAVQTLRWVARYICVERLNGIVSLPPADWKASPPWNGPLMTVSDSWPLLLFCSPIIRFAVSLEYPISLLTPLIWGLRSPSHISEVTTMPDFRKSGK